MASRWIKMRNNLAEDPAVIQIADITGLAEDHVVGKLHRLWSWADEQTYNGNACVTPNFIDRHVGVQGFASAMQRVGWLDVNEEGISIPKFERHMSESAKKRGLGAKRAEAFRSRKRNAVGELEASLDKRREDIYTTPTPSKEGEFDLKAAPEEFQAFWNAYPRKAGLARAFKTWQKMNPQAKLVSRILASIEAHKQTAKWKAGYIKSPSAWLRGQCWMDEVSASNGNGEIIETTAERHVRIARETAERRRRYNDGAEPEMVRAKLRNALHDPSKQPNNPAT